MLISVYCARGGCQCYKAVHESTEPCVIVWLLTSARLPYEAGFVLTFKTKDVST